MRLVIPFGKGFEVEVMNVLMQRSKHDARIWTCVMVDLRGEQVTSSIVADQQKRKSDRTVKPRNVK